ncbi:tetratricopeptide repeat protein [Fulvivirga sedimenti]|uniref:Tetratricopeptide repeat protein n=1 Tax=Fulvivirga sedimenti TaxID=2879465 RepID=A0A9X1L239_9BACT|nr:tetratricopeptide repeat protein [Fulvivirga sedimenti]MCA6078902.1 tetratricopeptide repeat protein [Fulvivirga sedimenti]
MKRLLIMLAVIVVAGVSYGQKKPKVNQAIKAMQDGNLGEAKEIIDAAAEYEKLKDDGKTWYYRALIYASLDTTSNAEYQNLVNDPLAVAMASFNKADELNTGNSDYFLSDPLTGFPTPRSQQVEMLWAYYLNKGVEAYQNDDIEGAVYNFERTTLVQPEDTTGYIYAASAAQAMQDYDRALQHYYTLINDLNYKTADIYNALLYIEIQVNKDNEKALELAREAKEEFPEDSRFAKTEINLLIQMGKADEARAGLESAIAAEPDNPDLYFSLGVMNEELGDKDAALNAYQKSVEVDPNYFNGNYNMAVLKYNQAVELVKARNNLGISSADQKKAREMDSEINTRLKEALPVWEKVNELEPNNRKTLETLQYLYVQLKMNDKAVAIAEQLDALPE